MSNFSYKIQEEGPVQQITYVSDTERGYLRFVSEDELDYPRLVRNVAWLAVKPNRNSALTSQVVKMLTSHKGKG